MGSSPFHGIFAALSQGQDSDDRKKTLRDDAATFALPGDEPVAAAAPAPARAASASQTGRVAVDIFEQDGYYIIKAPIAGVRMSDIDIEVNENVITISGNRKQTDTAAEGEYFLRECFWGAFSRSVTLPFPIDPRKIKATFNKECVLKILIPKEERVKIVKINEI